MAHDPKYATNTDRVAHCDELDAAIEAWTNTLTAEELLVEVRAKGSRRDFCRVVSSAK